MIDLFLYLKYPEILWFKRKREKKEKIQKKRGGGGKEKKMKTSVPLFFFPVKQEIP